MSRRDTPRHCERCRKQLRARDLALCGLCCQWNAQGDTYAIKLPPMPKKEKRKK